MASEQRRRAQDRAVRDFQPLGHRAGGGLLGPGLDREIEILEKEAEVHVVTADDAAALLGVTPRRVRQRLEAGELPGIRLAGRWWVDPAALNGEPA